MCEILVKATDNTHTDPTTDERSCWKTDDIVVVMDDGHLWGSKEGLPKFNVISLPGVATTSAKAYCVAWMTGEDIMRRSLYWWDNATQEFVNKDTGVRTYKDNI